jgi:hypothetical protein
MSSAPKSYCTDCKNYKDLSEFTADKNGNTYTRCQQCFHRSSVEFWANKQFKFCVRCETDVPLRKFNFWNGVPHRTCRKCWESEQINKRAANRAVSRGEATLLVKRPATASQCGGQPHSVQQATANKVQVLHSETDIQWASNNNGMERLPTTVLPQQGTQQHANWGYAKCT